MDALPKLELPLPTAIETPATQLSGTAGVAVTLQPYGAVSGGEECAEPCDDWRTCSGVRHSSHDANVNTQEHWEGKPRSPTRYSSHSALPCAEVVLTQYMRWPTTPTPFCCCSSRARSAARLSNSGAEILFFRVLRTQLSPGPDPRHFVQVARMTRLGIRSQALAGSQPHSISAERRCITQRSPQRDAAIDALSSPTYLSKRLFGTKSDLLLPPGRQKYATLATQTVPCSKTHTPTTAACESPTENEASPHVFGTRFDAGVTHN